ncbi:MAG: MBL fold metallo-hydrolase [Chitinophagales bacterium]|nr:MBL fold metallo-hydrolase [Chitinophagales bacterium]
MKLSFYGAARTVTGSKHLLELDNGKRILLDCGMFQGRGENTDQHNRHFGFDPASVDHVILSHAHIDHSGLIPRLVKHGFAGSIFCTPATAELCSIMLLDSAHIQEDDARYINERRLRKGKQPIQPLYETKDIPPVLPLFHEIEYNTPTQIIEGVELTFTDVGHILGSACVNLSIHHKGKTTKVVFTGDIGRYSNRLLKVPSTFPQADYIICESTYGDREHEPVSKVDERFLQIVKETCIAKGGKLLIPAFSIGRTQEVVNVLNDLEFKGLLPPIKVFVDSPLSYNATEIIKKYTHCFNERVQKALNLDPTPFNFDKLHYIRDVAESKALNQLKEPCIIISASGMAEAGRIKHHIKNNIEDPRNTLLLVGWCTPNSLGGRLKSGIRKVSIFGQEYDVNADVLSLDPFSAHADKNEMIKFLNCQNPSKIKGIFLVHGDEKVLPVWRQHLENEGFSNIEIPMEGQEFQLN